MSNQFKPSNDEANIRSTARGNIRQLGDAAQSDAHQSQILSALDILGAKLVRSEAERETMRKLLNEALDAQDKLENQLERSHINIQRRIDMMERKDIGLSQEDRDAIETQKKDVEATKSQLKGQKDRQVKIEDQLRDSQQTITKLQRRLDSQEQKRMKLQRRVERVENIAADAQNALQAKAMVLLTDQSEALRHLPHYNAESAMQTLDDLHAHPRSEKALETTGWPRRLMNSSSSTVLAVLIALGLGWGMATTLQPSQTALIMTENGQLAEIDISEAIVQPIQLTTNPILEQPQSEPTSLTTGGDIEGDIALMITDWMTDDILNQALVDIENNQKENQVEVATTTSETTAPFDVLETIPADNITMDRDLTLPDDMKQLEDKAFANIPEAQHDLAALYTAGQAGVTQNYERAVFWFQKAASQNIANAAYNLGVLYQQGLGQPQDLLRALDWYRRAAQLGHPEAQYNLGIAYIEGVGTRYNPNMAAAFFKQAAMSGIIEAAYNLGLILENGLLGEVRTDDALKWYRAAADQGSAESAEALRLLAQKSNTPVENAGLLEGGRSLAEFMTSTSAAIDGSANTQVADSDFNDDISLGSLVPSEEQMLIAQIQEQLRKNRLYNGPQDGIVGQGTVRAIQSYQRQQGLDIDGEPTQDLLIHMLKAGTG